MSKFLSLLAATFSIISGTTFGAIALNSPTTEWHAVVYSSTRSDYVNDHQTGSPEGDLVGSAIDNPVVQSAFYFKYDALSDQIAFRTRVDADSNPKGRYQGAFWVGFMLDSDDSVDLFAGFVNSGNSNTIGFYSPGGDLNTSPSNTSIVTGSPLYSEAGVANSNFLWTAVTVGPSGNDPVPGGTADIGGNGETDYFMTWVLPFSKLQSAAASLDFTVTGDNHLRLVIATSQNNNNINQDINGVGAGGIKSKSTYSALGAVSPLLTPSGGQVLPIPEPGTVSLFAAGAAYALFHWRFRRRR